MKTASLFTLPFTVTSALALPFDLSPRRSPQTGEVIFYTDGNCKTEAGVVGIPVRNPDQATYYTGPGKLPCYSAMFISSGDLDQWQLLGSLEGKGPIGDGDTQITNPKINQCVSFPYANVMVATGSLSLAGFEALGFKEVLGSRAVEKRSLWSLLGKLFGAGGKAGASGSIAESPVKT